MTTEITVSSVLGAFKIEGRVDFAIILWRGNRPRLRLVECKASRRDRTHHRVQVVLYRMPTRQVLKDAPLAIAGLPLSEEDIECVVARVDESTSKIQVILDVEPLDLDREEVDLERLLARGGSLDRAVRANLDDLGYEITPKCDGCVFNVHCLAESARQRRLELLGVSASVARALRKAGVADIDALGARAPKATYLAVYPAVCVLPLPCMGREATCADTGPRSEGRHTLSTGHRGLYPAGSELAYSFLTL